MGLAIMNEIPAATVKKIQTLAQIAADLRRGKDFNITRLTMLKSLCSDPKAAAQFALYLAKKTQQAMKRPGRSPSKTKQRYQRLVGSAVHRMTKHLREETTETRSSLEDVHSQIRSVQDRYEHQRWGGQCGSSKAWSCSWGKQRWSASCIRGLRPISATASLASTPNDIILGIIMG